MKTYPESRLTDLLIEFDEMGFAPTTVCPNAEQTAIEWKEQIVKEIQKLQAENAELRERLDNAGKFPCKVGDTIYQTDTNGTRIFKNTVKNIIFETDGVAFDERAIGESIFLTEEAVKEKMKKLQENNDD